MTEQAAIDHIKLFANLTAHELSLLETSLTRRSYRQNQLLFKHGDPGLSCFVIIEGSVGVFLDDPEKSEPIATLVAGETVGHMALVDKSRRSAVCQVVSSHAQLGELRSDDFERLFNAKTAFAYKILDNLVVDLVGRLRASNQTLLRASLERKTNLDKRTKKTVATQLLGGSDDWDPDKIEVLGMSLEHRIKRPK